MTIEELRKAIAQEELRLLLRATFDTRPLRRLREQLQEDQDAIKNGE